MKSINLGVVNIISQLNIPYEYLPASVLNESWLCIDGEEFFNVLEDKQFINYNLSEGFKEIRKLCEEHLINFNDAIKIDKC